jgi:hypothetical protein
VSEYFKGVPVELICEADCAYVTIKVNGQPEKIVDIIFQTKTKSGKLKKSPRYRFESQKVRDLIRYLETTLAVIEGRAPEPGTQQPLH